MKHNKKKAAESKASKPQEQQQSRMDSLLQEIDNVISKKKCSDKSGKVKK
jgi:hypothetical protein